MRPACRIQRQGTKGFTLVEVMATVVLIAIVIPVAMRGISMGTRMASHSKRQIEATCLAKAKIAEMVASRGWESGAHSGDFGREWPDYAWSVELTNWSVASVYQLAVRVSWRSSGSLQSQFVTLTTLVYGGAE